MYLIKQVEIHPLESIKAGITEFYKPLSQHQIRLVEVPPKAINSLYVHHFQTNQFLVVRGSIVIVVLQDGRYRYIGLRDDVPVVVRIPTDIPHGLINLTSQPCLIVNIALRYGPDDTDLDSHLIKPPIPYNLTAARSALTKLAWAA